MPKLGSCKFNENFLHMSRIFIECQPSELFKKESQSHVFEERCLVLAKDEDIVVTSYKIDPSYLCYLTNLGIGPGPTLYCPSKVTQDLAASILEDRYLLDELKSRAEGYGVDIFVPGQSVDLLNAELQMPVNFPRNFYDSYSTKTGFYQLARDIDLPTPNYFVANEHNHRKFMKFASDFKNTVFKSNNTIGGLGVFSGLPSRENFTNVSGNSPTYVIEEAIETRHHGSVQLFYTDDDQYRMIIDECFATNNSFVGFEYPPNFDLSIVSLIEAHAHSVAQYIKRGNVDITYCGIDFIISKSGDIFFHDLNPRKTGVLYPMAFIERFLKRERLNSYHVKTITLRIRADLTFSDIFRVLEPSGLLIKNKNDEGILIFNPQRLSTGCLSLIALAWDSDQPFLTQAANVLNKSGILINDGLN